MKLCATFLKVEAPLNLNQQTNSGSVPLFAPIISLVTVVIEKMKKLTVTCNN